MCYGKLVEVAHDHDGCSRRLQCRSEKECTSKKIKTGEMCDSMKKTVSDAAYLHFDDGHNLVFGIFFVRCVVICPFTLQSTLHACDEVSVCVFGLDVHVNKHNELYSLAFDEFITFHFPYPCDRFTNFCFASIHSFIYYSSSFHSISTENATYREFLSIKQQNRTKSRIRTRAKKERGRGRVKQKKSRAKNSRHEKCSPKQFTY